MTGMRYAAPAMRAGLWISLPVVFAGLSACTTTTPATDKADISTTTKFASADYGVKASPRVTTKKTVRVGGGHFQVGKPYEVAGKWYHPKINEDYDKVGVASWYGPNFHGRLTANGEIYNQYGLSAASKTLPLPCYARVTNEDNGDSVIVRVNDRGPFADNRIIDLSKAAAGMLHMQVAGTAKVRVKYVGLAPVDGDDSSYLLASYHPGDDAAPATDTGVTGVEIASNDTPEAGLPGVTLASDDIGADTANALPTSRPAVVPATAIVSEPGLSPAQKGIQAVLLPRVVPVPTGRPSLTTASAGEPSGASAVTAYVSRPHSAAPAAFEHVLAENSLTRESILRAWNSGAIAEN